MDKARVLRDLIARRGETVASVAKAARIPLSTVYTMLSRGIGSASVDRVLRVCRVLGITIEELYDIAEKKPAAAHSLAADPSAETLRESWGSPKGKGPGRG